MLRTCRLEASQDPELQAWRQSEGAADRQQEAPVKVKAPAEAEASTENQHQDDGNPA